MNLQLDKEEIKRKYENDLREYNLKLEQSNKIIKNISALKEEYKREITAYEKYINDIQSSKSIKQYRKQKILNFLNDVTRPTLLRLTDRKYKKGASEDFFEKHLEASFSKNIQTNCVLRLSSTYELVPDFIYFDENINLLIDIEIDEPYVGSSGEPIHHSESSDNERNSIFTSNKWIVIRFAEEQIFNNPKECVKAIENVIKSIKTGDKNFLIKPLPIKSIKQWSKEDAYKLGFSRYRHRYVPELYHEKIKIETGNNVEQLIQTSNRSLIVEKPKLKLPIASEPPVDDLPF